MTASRGGTLVLAMLLTGCVTQPRDPFKAASRALQRDDLIGALMAYDAVPVSHPRYPEARAGAVEVEQRMRRSQELVLEALMLRGEWRDEEALVALQRALHFWPSLPGGDKLIAATRHRLLMLQHEPRQTEPVVTTPPAAPLAEGPRREAPPASAAIEAPPPVTVSTPTPTPATSPEIANVASETLSVAATRPVQPSGALPVDAHEPSEPAPALPTPVASASAPASEPETQPDQEAASPRADDPVALALVVAEARLAHGELDGAVADLIELSRRNPSDLRVRVRLTCLLHQRALRHYGEGAVAAAISDWERVVSLDPADQVAWQSLMVAREESRQRDR